uniref:Uncharacterized protein n=1 Tax=Arundo donax TaxID=35708 RepID=A0A0A8ZDY3_ARUDO
MLFLQCRIVDKTTNELRIIKIHLFSVLILHHTQSIYSDAFTLLT